MICKKEYYNKRLENSIKGIRRVLNGIIGNGSTNTNYPHYFIDNDTTLNNINDVVNRFNNFL